MTRKKFFKIMSWVRNLVIVILGFIFYTVEYAGTDDNPGFIKLFFDQQITFSISVLMLAIITFVIVWILMAIWENWSLKKDELVSENTELKSKLKERDLKDELDRRALQRIINILPFEEMRAFTKDKDLGYSFPYEYIVMMHNLVEIQDDPTFTFRDTELEKLRNLLILKFKKLSSLFLAHAEQIGNTGKWCLAKDIEYSDPEGYSEVIKQANDTATEVWEIYHKLISLGREQLGE